MPQIAQQDYKVIAPKPGRDFKKDAAALGELKRSILNGIGFDCLIKDTLALEGDFSRVLGLYPDGSVVAVYSIPEHQNKEYEMPYTVEQYEGLSSVQNAIDVYGLARVLPLLTKGQDNVHLNEDDSGYFICVDGKYLIVTGESNIEALAIAENGPSEYFVNITWEDAQKLIGLPLV